MSAYLREHIKEDEALECCFQQVIINEPSLGNRVSSIFCGLMHRYELHHGVHFLDEALFTIVKLSPRYLLDCSLPDEAIRKNLKNKRTSKPILLNEINHHRTI